MKTLAIVYTMMVFTFVGAATGSPIQRKLILSGTPVPKNSKTYTVGLRYSVGDEDFCGGSLISPTHVLTASHCTADDIRWAAIGTHYLNGTQDGEVVAVMNHPNFSVNFDWGDDFALLELERPSSFKPIKLAAADDSDFKAGAMAAGFGWGLTGEGGEMSPVLLRVDLPLISDKDCAETTEIDETMVCAGGKLHKDICDGDSGGPLVIESPDGDSEDVLIGVVSWSNDDACGRGADYPGIYSRVSSARHWIDPIIKGSCFS